jgi:hypothetical protein
VYDRICDVICVSGPRKTTVVPDNNLPSGWSKHTIQRKHGNSAGKWDVFLVKYALDLSAFILILI